MIPSPQGEKTIDFANPDAVKFLNQALLKRFYGIKFWDIPEGFLCPPIPGRADYIHHIADLLAEGNEGEVPKGKKVRVLDIGTGANCVYPILGNRAYGWKFVGTEINAIAIRSANMVININGLGSMIEIRLQNRHDQIFRGISRPADSYAVSVCNPPFYTSEEEAVATNQKKVRNLTGDKKASPQFNFGGQAAELWCPGGELEFIKQMINESAEFPTLCKWFTTLVSNKKTLPALQHRLEKVGATEVRLIPMSHGNKITRILAWRY